MHVTKGNVVKMRDGRIVEVTDAPESLEPLEWISRHEYFNNAREVVTATMPSETIFVGLVNQGATRRGRACVYATSNRPTVVSDMSEVVSILR